MATKNGIKSIWRFLRDQEYSISSDSIGWMFERWTQVFTDVSDKALMDATQKWIGFDNDQIMEDRVYRNWIMKNGRTFPPTHILGSYLGDQARRPPTKLEIATGKWWSPSGTSTTAPQWNRWEVYHRRFLIHLDAGCTGIIQTCRLLIHLDSINTIGMWNTDWPSPDLECELSDSELDAYTNRTCAEPYIGCSLADARFDPEIMREERMELLNRMGGGTTIQQAARLRRYQSNYLS